MIVVSSLDAWLSVADTVVEPPFSEIELSASVSVTVGTASSSVSVSEAPITSLIPRLFRAVAVTVVVRSGSSFVLFTAVIVAVSLLFEI